MRTPEPSPFAEDESYEFYDSDRRNGLIICDTRRGFHSKKNEVSVTFYPQTFPLRLMNYYGKQYVCNKDGTDFPCKGCCEECGLGVRL